MPRIPFGIKRGFHHIIVRQMHLTPAAVYKLRSGWIRGDGIHQSPKSYRTIHAPGPGGIFDHNREFVWPISLPGGVDRHLVRDLDRDGPGRRLARAARLLPGDLRAHGPFPADDRGVRVLARRNQTLEKEIEELRELVERKR